LEKVTEREKKKLQEETHYQWKILVILLQLYGKKQWFGTGWPQNNETLDLKRVKVEIQAWNWKSRGGGYQGGKKEGGSLEKR